MPARPSLYLQVWSLPRRDVSGPSADSPLRAHLHPLQPPHLSTSWPSAWLSPCAPALPPFQLADLPFHQPRQNLAALPSRHHHRLACPRHPRCLLLAQSRRASSLTWAAPVTSCFFFPLPLSTFAPLTVCFPCRDTLLNLKLIIQFSVQALKWLYCYSECSSASKAQHDAVFGEGLMLCFPVSFCSSSSGLAISQMCPPGFCLGSCSRSLCWECSFPTAQLLFKSPFHLHPPVTFGPSALLNSCITICHCCDLLLFDSKFRENRDGFVCYSSPIA